MLWLLDLMGFDSSQPFVQSGFLNFLGVLVTGAGAIATWYLNRRRDRWRERAAAEARQNDLRRALWSDILPIWVGLIRLGTAEHKLDRIRAAFDEARAAERVAAGAAQRFTPFVVPAATPLFADRLVQDVASLEDDEIEPVVTFYHQLARLNQMSLSAREPDFAALPLDRKERALIQVTQLEIKAEETAYAALTALEKRLERGPHDPDMVMRRRRELVKLPAQNQRSGS